MSNIEIYRMKKRAEQRRRKRVVCRVLKISVLAAFALTLVLFFVLKSPVQAQEDGETYFKYYNTLRVEKGDSLWGYAQQYSTGSGKSMDAYIDEVCSINHIAKNATLRTGTTLTVPYYSTEYKCNAD